MARKKIVPAAAQPAAFDPEKTYEVSLLKPVPHPTRPQMTLRPAHNPYVVKGAVALALGGAIDPAAVKEIVAD